MGRTVKSGVKLIFLGLSALALTILLCVAVFLGYMGLEQAAWSMALFVAFVALHAFFNKIKFYTKKARDYEKFISVYEAILTSSDECWIALNKSGVVIGYSEKVRALFGTRDELKKDNIPNCLIDEHAEILRNKIDSLIDGGQHFKMICNGKYGMRSLVICGARFSIKGVITNCLWVKDLTEFVNEKNVINQQLKSVTDEKKALEYLIDHISVPLWVRDSEMRVEFCNKTYEEIVEKNKSEIIAGNVPLVKGAAFGEGDSLARNAVKTEKAQTIMQNIIVKGGRKKYELHEIPDADGKTIGFGVDKTEEYKALRELDRYIKAHSDVLEMLSTAVAIFNVDTRLVFFNTAYKNLTSIEEGWLHTNPKFIKVLDEMRRLRRLPEIVDFAKYKKEKLNIFTSINTTVQELEYLPDGRTLRVVASPYPLGGVMFMYEDVSDNLDLQRQHNTLLEVQKETINNLYEGVAVYASDNRVKLFNPAFRKVWNIDESVNLFGMHITEVMEYMKGFMNYGDDWLRYKESAISNLTDRIPKTGRMFRQNDTVVNFSYLPLPDGSHVHSYIDVTASWVVEKALYEKNRALEEAEHVKSQFISNISEELKAALEKIVAASHVLEEPGSGAAERVLECTKELYALVSDLTDLASIEAGTIDISNDQINLYDLLVNIKDIFVRRFYGKDIKINFEADNGVTIVGDAKRLRQVILNVLNIGFNSQLGSELEIRVSMLSGYVKVVVMNVDIRWDSDTCKVKLLPVIKSIMELHGGKIIPTESHNFAFLLPVAESGSKDHLVKNRLVVDQISETPTSAVASGG